MDTKEAPNFIKEADEKNGVNVVNGVDVVRLLSYIERVERLEEEKKALQNDIKEVFDEAKAAHFDVKAIKSILKMRRRRTAGRGVYPRYIPPRVGDILICGT